MTVRTKHGEINYLIEVIGPAGAGKTTLSQALRNTLPSIKYEELPQVRSFSNLPFFIKNVLPLIPAALRKASPDDRFATRRELAWMAILNGWPDLLAKKEALHCQTMLLDQGPIFLMAALAEFGPENLKPHRLSEWWEATFMRWSHMLDLLIWLDASDEVLSSRVHTRKSYHVMKDAPDSEFCDFLARFRRIYDFLVTQMARRNSSLQVVRIDTGPLTPAEVVTQVLAPIEKRQGQTTNDSLSSAPNYGPVYQINPPNL